MLKTYDCDKSCCKIQIAENAVFPKELRRGHCYKAGVCIFDPKERRILLVMSNGSLWGLPKGTVKIEEDENQRDCALREVYEETGIVITPNMFERVTKVKNRAIYYYVELDSEKEKVELKKVYNKGNDTSGITWIKIDCLEECIKQGKIVLNYHSRVVFKRFLEKEFPYLKFTKVRRKRRRRALE